MATLKKSRLGVAKEAYKAASNNYISQLSKGENNHLKNGNLLAKKVGAEQKLKQETERAKKVYADNKNKLKSGAIPAYVSLKGVVRNKGMKNADVKGTVKLAEKTLSTAKQKLRTHDASMGGTKQQHDALKKQVKTAEKNLKSLNKTATKVNNKDLSKSLGSVTSNKGMKKSNLQGTYNEQKRRAYNHYIESQTDYDGNGGVSTYNMTEYLKAKKAQKQMKSIEKTAKKQGVKLKK